MKNIQHLFLLAFLVVFYSNLQSQSINDTYNLSDWQLIRQHSFENPAFNERKVQYGFNENKKTLNPLYHLMSASMYFYQKSVSSILSRQCAYIPSCSKYSKDLIKQFGLFKGIICTADRLTRCTRIALSDKQSIYLLKEGNGHIYENSLRYKF